YEALSYHWGDFDSSNSILIDGKTFAVTKNLFEALQCLSTRNQSRILWIDALCIH
ncbi:hypothetical protein BDZ45DRAFT_558551, partial [Acephala macrosclerotiorum]